MYQVNRHPNTQRKLLDWDLVVVNRWLIIGDSNLSHIPDHRILGLQIESYPGAHFRHAQALFEKTFPRRGLIVEKIILSFGINSRGNKSKETTFKNAQAALKAAGRRFPRAEIFIQLVNFSKDLPPNEQENLMILNEELRQHTPYIPLLPDNQFSTVEDHIHWTAKTGEAFLCHWMRRLNA
jgi:hypothetical protein